MIEEPYRWLEAMGNRREYVRDQLRGGTPAIGASLPEGILLLGVGTGASKVFELFDRHALAGLGHPADIEKIRQIAIDTAHMEAFNRAPEDVSLRRLVSFGLSPQLKTNFEQIFSAPFLVELLLAELGLEREQDVLLRLHFDGSFHLQKGGVLVAASKPDLEEEAQRWLSGALAKDKPLKECCDLLLQSWWCLLENQPFTDTQEEKRRQGWRTATENKCIEIGWLSRTTPRPAKFELLTLEQLGL